MKSKRLWLLAVIVLLALTVLTISCNQDNPAAHPANVNVKISTTPAVVDYGNGIYYFPYKKDDFGNALATFTKEHPKLEIITMASDDDFSYGRTIGYFVIFRSIEK